MAKKNLTKEEIDGIMLNIKSPKSVERRKAAINIRKYELRELSGCLLDAYLKEKEDKRTWETQVAMIQSLGVIGCSEALSLINDIVLQNERLDMITFVSSLSYVRLKRKEKKDIKPILELLDFGNLSVLCGAMASLAFDDIIPSKADIRKLIEIMNKIDVVKLFQKGVHDPRSYFISAMSKWDRSITEAYLNQFKQDNSLSKYVEATEKGQKSRIEQ